MLRCGLAFLMLPRLAAADLLLNEILYDPPGADAGREFVEILNAGSMPAALDGVVLEAGDGARPGVWRVVWQALAGQLDPGAFLVIGGDSVRVARERLTADLQNGPDALRLRRGDVVLDRVGYGELTAADLFERRSAPDVANASLARRVDGDDTDDNAADFIASAPTPGRRNTPWIDLVLQVEPPDPRRAWPGRLLVARARIVNRGVHAASAWTLAATVATVVGEPGRDPWSLGTAQSMVVPALAPVLLPGDSTQVELAWTGLPGLAAFEVRVGAAADEDSTNDVARAFVRVGSGDVILNEILFAPAAGAPEWIELWNRGRQAIDLTGWTLADGGGRRTALEPSRLLLPNAYALAAADTTDIPFDAVRIAVRPWPALNNTDGEDGFADDLVLRDAAGIVQDALRYRAADGVRGRSLERLTPDADVRGLLWAPSKDGQGATPGRANSGAGLPRARLDVQCTPNPFSPNNDGRDDALGIVVEVPAGASGWRLRVFDLDGRARATLAADRLGPGPRHVVWDGRDARGAALAAGVYVLHLEVLGAGVARSSSRHVVGLVRP